MDRKSEEILRSFISDRFQVNSQKKPHYLPWISKDIEVIDDTGNVLYAF